MDNNKFLFVYWSLACALAAGADREEAAKLLAWNARLLVGLAFLFATLWKLRAGGYWDGSFLYLRMLTDDRFQNLAGFLGGISVREFYENRGLIEALKHFPAEGLGVTLAHFPRLEIWARLISCWTLAIEALIAAAFLAPGEGRPFRRLRDLFLLAFIATTYGIVPVKGFAFVLNIMGFAQCERAAPDFRPAYLVLFALILLV
jgi:hypothetical protein